MLGTRLVGLVPVVPVVPVRVWSGEEAENDGLVITTRDSKRLAATPRFMLLGAPGAG